MARRHCADGKPIRLPPASPRLSRPERGSSLALVAARIVLDPLIDPERLALTSPYIREKIRRFGDYDIATVTTPPDAFDPRQGNDLDAPQARVRAGAQIIPAARFSLFGRAATP